MSTLEVDKIIPQSGTATQVGENGDTINVPSGATLNINSGATIANNGTATGFDTDTNDKVKVSTNDTTPGFLNGKLVAGTNITLTEGSDGGNETLTAALSGTIPTARLGSGTASGTTFLAGDQTYKEAGGGLILQVIEATTSTQQDNSSTTPADTGLTVNITPTSASNKVLVMASFPVRFFKSGNYYANGMFILSRGAVDIIARSGSNVQDFGVEAGALGSSSYVANPIKMHMQGLDSPNTTSQITYKVQSAAFAGTTVNNMWNNQKGSIVVMEIKG